MTVDQRLLRTLHALAAARQQELLDFAEFLRSETAHAPRETDCELTPLPVLRGRMVPGWKDAVDGAILKDLANVSKPWGKSSP